MGQTEERAEAMEVCDCFSILFSILVLEYSGSTPTEQGFRRYVEESSINKTAMRGHDV